MEGYILKITAGSRVIAVANPHSTILMVAEDMCMDYFGAPPEKVLYKKLDSYLHSDRDEVEYHNFTADLHDSSASCLVRARNGLFIWVEKFSIQSSFYFQRLLMQPKSPLSLSSRIVTSDFLTGVIIGTKNIPDVIVEAPVIVEESVKTRGSDELSFDDVFDCAACEESLITPDSIVYIASDPSMKRADASIASQPIALSSGSPSEDDYGWYVSLDSLISSSFKGFFKR